MSCCNAAVRTVNKVYMFKPSTVSSLWSQEGVHCATRGIAEGEELLLPAAPELQLLPSIALKQSTCAHSLSTPCLPCVSSM